MPEQVDDLFEARFSCEFVDVVTGIDELSDIPANVGDCGGVCYDAFKAFCDDWHRTGMVW